MAARGGCVAKAVVGVEPLVGRACAAGAGPARHDQRDPRRASVHRLYCSRYAVPSTYSC